MDWPVNIQIFWRRS